MNRASVCWNIVGHAMFLEDAIETGNVISHNLVIYVKEGKLLPHSDPQATGFWY
jgi:hypothetical protein